MREWEDAPGRDGRDEGSMQSPTSKFPFSLRFRDLRLYFLHPLSLHVGAEGL